MDPDDSLREVSQREVAGELKAGRACGPKGCCYAGSEKDVSRCARRHGLSARWCIRPASSANAPTAPRGPAAASAWTPPLALVARSLAVEWPSLGLDLRELALKQAPNDRRRTGGDRRLAGEHGVLSADHRPGVRSPSPSRSVRRGPSVAALGCWSL